MAVKKKSVSEAKPKVKLRRASSLTRKSQKPSRDLIVPAPEQNAVVPNNGKQTGRFGEAIKSKYNPKTHPEIAFELLSTSDTAVTKSHLCRAFCVNIKTLGKWLKKYPRFKRAYDAGMTIGEANWRDRLAQAAFQPSTNVNNGIIKLLSANVYKISDAPQVTINNNNEQTQENTSVEFDPEKYLKEKGIPVPDVGIRDMEIEKDEGDDG